MNKPAYFSQPIQDARMEPSDPANRNSAAPSEKTGYRPDDGLGGTYQKEGNKQPRGNEMPGIDESTDEGEARNERIKIVHDPKSDDKELDAFSKRVNEAGRA